MSRLLQERDLPVVDADQIVRDVEEPGERGWRALVCLWGPSVLTAEGRLDRVRMGRWVFSEPDVRRAVNEALHPLVRQAIWRVVRDLEDAGYPLVVVDVPLLIENGLWRLVDAVWIVYATREQQKTRLMNRNHLAEADAERRLGSQWPLADKLPYATVVLDNTRDVQHLERQVDQHLRELVP